jgi:hypothetical protein
MDSSSNSDLDLPTENIVISQMNKINTPPHELQETLVSSKKLKAQIKNDVTQETEKTVETSSVQQPKRRRRVYTKVEDEIILKTVQAWGDRGASNLWLGLGKEMNRIPQDLKRRYSAIINPKKNKFLELEVLRNEMNIQNDFLMQTNHTAATSTVNILKENNQSSRSPYPIIDEIQKQNIKSNDEYMMFENVEKNEKQSESCVQYSNQTLYINSNAELKILQTFFY